MSRKKRKELAKKESRIEIRKTKREKHKAKMEGKFYQSILKAKAVIKHIIYEYNLDKSNDEAKEVYVPSAMYNHIIPFQKDGEFLGVKIIEWDKKLHSGIILMQDINIDKDFLVA